MQLSSKKVIKLLDTIAEARAALDDGGTGLTAIVFVKMRQTAAVLAHVLRRAAALSPEMDFIRPDFVVGGRAGNTLYKKDDSGRRLMLTQGPLARAIEGCNMLDLY